MVNRKILISCPLSLATIVIIILFLGNCSGKNSKTTGENDDTGKEIVEVEKDTRVEIVDTLNLRIYYPQYSKIDLITNKMPSKADTSVILVAAAAFTAGTPEEHAQGTVAGDHVSGGVRKQGYACKRNNGAFVYYNGQPKFVHGNYSNELDTAAKNGGSGFAQEMMIHNGRIVTHTRPDTNVNEFRALCLINGKPAIADSNGKVEFGNFINELLKAGATEALYMDMGAGWNQSWYRDECGKPVDIHPESNVGSNWITFYK